MRFKIHLILGLLLLTFLLNSCVVYYPQIAGTILPSEKGDLDMTGSFSPFSGFYFSQSYSPSNHLALHIHENIVYTGVLGQSMVGYYKNFNNHLILANYIGASIQYIYTHYKDAEFYSKTTIKGTMPVYFNQLNFGVKIKSLEFGTFFKLGYHKGILNLKTVYDDNYYHYPTEEHNEYASGLLFENAYYLRTGKKNTKFFMAIGISQIPDFESTYNFSNLRFTLGFGVSYHFNKNVKPKDK